MHEEGNFVTFDNKELYWQAWVPEEVRAVNIYLHGGFAFSDDAIHMAETLFDQNIATYAYDLRGWGHWEGTSGHINNRSDYLKDTKEFVDFVKLRHKDEPYILSGHSMGGLIALRFLIDNQDEFVCTAISAPWIATKTEVPAIFRFLSRIFSVIWPTFSDDANFDIDTLTHDNQVVTRHYENIEKGLRKTTGTARWYNEIRKMQEEVIDDCGLITLPVIMFQGGQDLLVKEKYSQIIYDKLGSEKKKWDYYPRFYHEVWNEEEREQPLGRAKNFILKHLNLKEL